ncbi:MAG: type II toxin-antitoxin system VapB family antitoxin [Dissulfurispiraceae bacterium]|jgi:antitoxin VapB|nr:type II toxin-antitoxin system VapB family antitoxin [Dissulfurispiraceae bacterium]
MITSKVFTSGNSQAVRLPKQYQVKDSELFIQKIGDLILLFPKNKPWTAFEESLNEFPADFFAEGRQQPKIQKRKGQ